MSNTDTQQSYYTVQNNGTSYGCLKKNRLIFKIDVILDAPSLKRSCAKGTGLNQAYNFVNRGSTHIAFIIPFSYYYSRCRIRCQIYYRKIKWNFENELFGYIYIYILY